MSKIIAVNAGSSSLKFQLFEMDDESVITSGIVERIGMDDAIFTIKYNGQKETKTLSVPTHNEAVELLLKTLIDKEIVHDLTEIKGIGHRIVQGGPYFDQSVIINEDVKAKIKELIPLAPLHNGPHLIGIEAFEKAIPEAGAVAVFDTAFHQSIPDSASIYPIPYEVSEKYKIKKYGAHGTSHRYVSERVIELLGKPEHSHIIVAHLGAGGSLTAVKDGKSVNTSMGLTPLAGVMMATRCGDVDASVFDYLCEQCGYEPHDVFEMFNKKSGLLGVSGVSGDMRDVKAAADEGNKRAQLAISIFERRVVDYIGKYYMELGHVDAIAFTAGIGENSSFVRHDILNMISEATGVVIDDDANENRKGERLITKPESKIKVYVVPTDEELMIARDTKRLLNL